MQPACITLTRGATIEAAYQRTHSFGRRPLCDCKAKAHPLGVNRQMLFIRGDEAEEAWRIIDPVMAAWAADEVPMQEYAAGTEPQSARSDGQARSAHLRSAVAQGTA